MKDKKKSNPLMTVFLIIAIAVFLFAAYKLIGILLDYQKGDSEYENIVQEQTMTVQVEQTADNEEPVPQVDNEIYPDDFRPDFASLQKENKDCVAWIRFPNIDINYPIMQGTDNVYYLKHTFYGEKVTAASIFMDFNNTPDFTDDNTIIYGHNMKNGSMFAKLNKYADQSYYEASPYFWIYTPTTIYRYDIFSTHVVNVDHEEAYCIYGMEDEFATYLKWAKENADYNIDVDVTTQDRVITLYTCNRAGSSYRYQVHAKQAAAFDAATGAWTNLPQQPKAWEAGYAEVNPDGDMDVDPNAEDPVVE